jgi:hypothetical protein
LNAVLGTPNLLTFMQIWSLAAELDSILKETKKVPTEKYSEPITANHEYGTWSAMQPS